MHDLLNAKAKQAGIKEVWECNAVVATLCQWCGEESTKREEELESVVREGVAVRVADDSNSKSSRFPPTKNKNTKQLQQQTRLKSRAIFPELASQDL